MIRAVLLAAGHDLRSLPRSGVGGCSPPGMPGLKSPKSTMNIWLPWNCTSSGLSKLLLSKTADGELFVWVRNSLTWPDRGLTLMIS